LQEIEKSQQILVSNEMDSGQLDSILNADRFTSKIHNGVFACDQLPKNINYPAAFVINTDPSYMPGMHWVAVYFNKQGKCSYFDSYGLAPFVNSIKAFLGKEYQFNNLHIQSDDSNVCGHYCILFLTRAARGQTLQNIIAQFNFAPAGYYDNMVKCMVTAAFDKLPRIKYQCNQKCLSFTKWKRNE
jgi:hypothetical protein